MNRICTLRCAQTNEDVSSSTLNTQRSTSNYFRKILFFLSLSICSIMFLPDLFSQNVCQGYIDGQLYFNFHDNYTINFKINDDNTVDYDQLPELHDLFDKYDVTLITRPLLIFDDPKLARIFRLNFSAVNNIDFFIKELMQYPDIENAEKIPLYETSITFNDPFYMDTIHNETPLNFKWHLEMINAPQAWDIQTGSPAVKVAIVDNAVWGAHPDLNILTENQCDVGSGFIDEGDATPPATSPQSYNCESISQCDNYYWSHGTHCAGLVGAINDNGIGISSIGGGVTLMGIRASDEGYARYILYGMDGVAWAVNNGAKVVSMSYSSSTYSSYNDYFFQTGAENGVVFVAAAGNDGNGDNLISYPAGYSSVIGVASVDADGKLSNFSQWGNGRADIAAPGGLSLLNGTTTYPNLLSTTYCVNQLYRLWGFNAFDETYYDGMKGTSMACPMTAGLVGLMASAYPEITYEQALYCLQSTATPLANGSNQIDGNGYINAFEAVLCAQDLISRLAVNPSSLSFDALGGSQQVVVSSNINWEISNHCEWITVLPTAGYNDGTFTVITDPNHSPLRTCTITLSGEDLSETINITQEGNVDVETYNIYNVLTIYPNPTTGLLHLKSDFEIAKLQVFDIMGRTVFETGNIDHDKSYIDISHLSDAFYLIKVCSSEGDVQYRKIVKN